MELEVPAYQPCLCLSRVTGRRRRSLAAISPPERATPVTQSSDTARDDTGPSLNCRHMVPERARPSAAGSQPVDGGCPPTAERDTAGQSVSPTRAAGGSRETLRNVTATPPPPPPAPPPLGRTGRRRAETERRHGRPRRHTAGIHSPSLVIRSGPSSGAAAGGGRTAARGKSSPSSAAAAAAGVVRRRYCPTISAPHRHRRSYSHTAAGAIWPRPFFRGPGTFPACSPQCHRVQAAPTAALRRVGARRRRRRRRRHSPAAQDANNGSSGYYPVCTLSVISDGR